MELTLEALGITQEELQDRVVEALVQKALRGIGYDEDEREFESDTQFTRQLDKRVKEALNKAVEDLGEKHVLPYVNKLVENLTLQKTNEWGEPKGKPQSFTEYLVHRAEVYMNEKVDHNGKSKTESDYGWSGRESRLTYLVNQHLKYSIETAMKQALSIANSAIATGIEQTVKTQLEAIVKGIRTSVEVPRS